MGRVIKSLNTSGVGWYRSMTPTERHAELVYTESLFEKGLLGIVYSGDWLAFIKETSVWFYPACRSGTDPNDIG